MHVSVYVWGMYVSCLQDMHVGFSNIHAYANLHFLIFFWWFSHKCLSVYVSQSMTWQMVFKHTYIHQPIFIHLPYIHSFRACIHERVTSRFRSQGWGPFPHEQTFMLISLIVDSILADFVQPCMYVWGLRKYPPSQISKNCIVVQILNVFREEWDPTPGLII